MFLTFSWVLTSIIIAYCGCIWISLSLCFRLCRCSSHIIPIISHIYPIFTFFHSFPIISSLIKIIVKFTFNISSLTSFWWCLCIIFITYCCAITISIWFTWCIIINRLFINPAIRDLFGITIVILKIFPSCSFTKLIFFKLCYGFRTILTFSRCFWRFRSCINHTITLSSWISLCSS